jgi:hypothetical protein
MMHGPINVKSSNNISEWQMGFNSAFKGLNMVVNNIVCYKAGNVGECWLLKKDSTPQCLISGIISYLVKRSTALIHMYLNPRNKTRLLKFRVIQVNMKLPAVYETWSPLPSSQKPLLILC